MRTRCLLPAIALAVACGMAGVGAAMAQQQPRPPPKRVVPDDPSISRPPPRPPERPYVQPQRGPSAPMQRIEPVPPLAQPPTR